MRTPSYPAPLPQGGEGRSLLSLLSPLPLGGEGAGVRGYQDVFNLQNAVLSDGKT